jgi:hypothetical protein
MALVFQRGLAIPVLAVAFFTVALTAPPTAMLFLMPPTTAFAIAAVGIAAIVFWMPGAIPWLRPSRALVRVLPFGHSSESGPDGSEGMLRVGGFLGRGRWGPPPVTVRGGSKPFEAELGAPSWYIYQS